MPFGNPALGGVPGVFTGGYAGYAGIETPNDEDDEDEDEEDEDEEDEDNEVSPKRGIAHYTEFRDKVSGLKVKK